MTVLTEQHISQALTSLPGWTCEPQGLHRRFVFGDFVQAFGFMTQVALLAERAGHHPDWRNSYKTVDISLYTHEAGGITNKDLALAREIQRVAEAQVGD